MKADDLRALTSATVLSADERSIGEIAAVHVNQSSELLFVEIEAHQPHENLIVPAVSARIQDLLILPYGAADVQRGPTLEEGDPLSVELIDHVLQYYNSIAPMIEPAQAAPSPEAPDPSEPPARPGKGEDDPYKRINLPPIVKSLSPAIEEMTGAIQQWQFLNEERPEGV